MRSLRHITTDTGDARESARAEVEDGAIDTLESILRDGRGMVPPIGWAAWFRTPGGYGFEIRTAPPPAPIAVIGTLCTQYMHGGRMAEAAGLDIAPASTPWLAVSLGEGVRHLSDAEIRMLGDLERCLAWALIERGNEWPGITL